MRLIQLINGPNLNRLGRREPEVYGSATLSDIESKLTQQALEMGYRLQCMQSNSEGQLIDAVHAAADAGAAFIIINPGALTHTSIALRDGLLAVSLPFIEVHISNVHAREPFRHHSYFSDVAVGVICGLGTQGYEFALQSAHQYLSAQQDAASINRNK